VPSTRSWSKTRLVRRDMLSDRKMIPKHRRRLVEELSRVSTRVNVFHPCCRETTNQTRRELNSLLSLYSLRENGGSQSSNHSRARCRCETRNRYHVIDKISITRCRHHVVASEHRSWLCDPGRLAGRLCMTAGIANRHRWSAMTALFVCASKTSLVTVESLPRQLPRCILGPP
jgi:hypothetical protein